MQSHQTPKVSETTFILKGGNTLEQLQIWDSHVHLFPPEIYNNWETYRGLAF